MKIKNIILILFSLLIATIYIHADEKTSDDVIIEEDGELIEGNTDKSIVSDSGFHLALHSEIVIHSILGSYYHWGSEIPEFALGLRAVFTRSFFEFTTGLVYGSGNEADSLTLTYEEPSEFDIDFNWKLGILFYPHNRLALGLYTGFGLFRQDRYLYNWNASTFKDYSKAYEYTMYVKSLSFGCEPEAFILPAFSIYTRLGLKIIHFPNSIELVSENDYSSYDPSKVYLKEKSDSKYFITTDAILIGLRFYVR